MNHPKLKLIIGMTLMSVAAFGFGYWTAPEPQTIYIFVPVEKPADCATDTECEEKFGPEPGCWPNECGDDAEGDLRRFYF